MKLKDILAISGKGGLYKFISQGRNGIIVESFEDNKRMVVHSSAKVSALEDIAIFTESEEVPLGEIFKKIFEKQGGKETISHKSSPEELKALLESVLPDYDRERVYVSDMKKLVNWYNLLLGLNLLIPEEETKDEVEKEAGDENHGAKSEHDKKDIHASEKKTIKKGVQKNISSKTMTKSAPKAAKPKMPTTKSK
jgi:hypothetical protein